jgi:ArsR family transcriptional regulator
MAKKEFSEKQVQLARLAKALSHPVRIAILQLLVNETCCYHGDMSEILPVAKSTLSQHLNELKEVGLIQGTITAPNVRYCINDDVWQKAQILFAALFTNINVNETCLIK